MTHRTHPAWTDAADAATIAEALGITDAAITAANPTPGTTLVLTSHALLERAAAKRNPPEASSDLAEMTGYCTRASVADVLLAVRTGPTGRDVAVLGPVPKDLVLSTLHGATLRWLVADQLVPEMVGNVLAGYVGAGLETARLRDAVTAQHAATKAQKELRHRVELFEAARAVAAAGLPMPGKTSVVALSKATDIEFVRLTRAAVTLFPDATLTGALFRLTGKDHAAMDAAYAAFWSHSTMRRDLAEGVLALAGRWVHQVDPDLVVAYLRDPIAFFCGPRLAELTHQQALSAVMDSDFEALRAHLLAGYPDDVEGAHGPQLAAVALRRSREGDVAGVASAWQALAPCWRSILMVGATDPEQATVIQAVRSLLAAAQPNPQSAD